MNQVPNDDLFESTKMTFGEHLEELRGALFRALIGLAISTGFCLLFADRVVHWIEVPLREALDRFYSGRAVQDLEDTYGTLDDRLAADIMDRNLTFENRYIELDQLKRLLGLSTKVDTAAPDGSSDNVVQVDAEVRRSDTLLNLRLVPIRLWSTQDNKISAFGVPEVFMIWMKAGLVSGFILASPWVLYQVWGFVAAGLYPHEKKYVYTFFPLSVVLFLSGAALAYFFVFRYVLDFLFSFNLMVQIDPQPRISEWLSFVLLMPLGFGISFQLPLVMFVLERVGIFEVKAYLDNWRIAMLVIFFLSMILTPAEPISMLLMALPLSFLYFGGIAMCLWMPRSQNPFGDVPDPE